MLYWIVIVSTLIAVVLAAAIGANDVGNSFATSVGTKVLSIRQAVVIASVCEFSGSMLMGAYVSETLRTGIINDFLLVFEPGVDENLYMLGTMCVLLGSTIWLCIATYLNMPVSTTHSVVGSIVGFVVTFKGYSAIKWMAIGKIVLSWIISPLIGLVLAGPLSFTLSKFVVLTDRPKAEDPAVEQQLIEQQAEKSLNRTLITLPFIIGGTISILMATIFVKGSKALYLHLIPWYIGLSGSIGVGILIGIITALSTPLLKKSLLSRDTNEVNPLLVTEEIRQQEQETDQTKEETDLDTSSKLDDSLTSEKDKKNNKVYLSHTKPANRVFSLLQVLCAALTSFSHGANDVSNAIGPLSAIFMIYTAGSIEAALKATMPWYILALGAGGIVLGLSLFGQRVIETVGMKLTKNQLQPHQGFVSQLCGASIVMLCSKFGLPVSTTNSIVGAVVGVGIMDKPDKNSDCESPGTVSWGLLTNIIISWLVTLPVSAMITSASFSFLKWVV